MQMRTHVKQGHPTQARTIRVRGRTRIQTNFTKAAMETTGLLGATLRLRVSLGMASKIQVVKSATLVSKITVRRRISFGSIIIMRNGAPGLTITVGEPNQCNIKEMGLEVEGVEQLGEPIKGNPRESSSETECR